MANIEQLAVNSLRMLSMDQINKANSGHPGLPLGAAPMAYVLWSKIMNQNPKNSKWVNRDRFVLSAGHGSSLLYSLLHLSGYNLSIEDLKEFRQLGSMTPGHPEYGHTDGVEATTGPLGQGFANAVGMAMAESHLAAMYNKEGYQVIDHYTYALCGDGDLMEGVSAEAASLAGHLKLGKLIVLYDSNDICLDGPISETFTESVQRRFEAYGWQVLRVEDGNDLDSIEKAINEAKVNSDKPTLIEIKTVIGYGAPKEGTNKVHGAPLGLDDTEALKKRLGWEEEAFNIPEEVYDHFNKTVAARGAEAEKAWQGMFEKYGKEYPELLAQWNKGFGSCCEEEIELPVFDETDSDMASRKSSSLMIQSLAKQIPTLWGGSADLSSSNNTLIEGDATFNKENPAGRNIWYGVREFAMAAIMNGIALHGGTKTYAATFFVFSDYFKGALRLAALSKLPVTYVLTHDSIAVGEDGPTHQPVEQLVAWRSVPNLDVIRPADANEVAAAWKCAVTSENHPTMLVLSRQNLKVLHDSKKLANDGVKHGAYVISEAEKEAEGVIIATGSEVGIAVEAQKVLREEGIDVKVVSMPSWYRFEMQSEEYKEKVLPKALRNRLSVEASLTFGWEKYVGIDGASIGMTGFGASGKGGEVLKHFGFTAENIVKVYKENFVK